MTMTCPILKGTLETLVWARTWYGVSNKATYGLYTPWKNDGNIQYSNLEF